MNWISNKHYQTTSRSTDILHHLGIHLNETDFISQFSRTKYVIMGGGSNRIGTLARDIHSKLQDSGQLISPVDSVRNLLEKRTDRFVLYRVDNVILVNHGIGSPSILIVLHEIVKLLHFAKCPFQVTFFRFGTCGGLGCAPGTFVLTERCLNSRLEPVKECIRLGKTIRHDSSVSAQSVSKMSSVLQSFAPELHFQVGTTLCTDDFFEEQGRVDGAFCEFELDECAKFLEVATKEHGVRNIEMESSTFFATLNRVRAATETASEGAGGSGGGGVAGAVMLGLVLVDRMGADCVNLDKATISAWERKFAAIFIRYLEMYDEDYRARIGAGALASSDKTL